MSLLIAHARLLDPASGMDAPGFVAIKDGLITHAGPKAPAGQYRRTLEAEGQWLMPGIVDLCARLREPGATHKATIRSEIAAAQAGGITTLCIPPDTRPVIDTPSVVDRIQGRVAQAGGGLTVRVLGALTQGLEGAALPDMAALAATGVAGVTNAYAPLANALITRRALEYAQGCGLTVHVLPQEASLSAGCAHEGAVATRLGLAGIPTAAETVSIAQWLALVEQTGARVHFGRLSSARGVEMVAQAQRRGAPVTADVAAHQLFLTEDDVAGYNPQCHVLPPLRTAADRAALRQGLAAGVISAVCSDHQPHEADAKTNPFPMTEPGICGLETLLPLVLALVHEKALTPLAAAARLSQGPAGILGLDAVGLRPGAAADLVLLDPRVRWRLRAADLVSAGRNTPFDGGTFRGRATRSWHAGRAELGV